MIREKRTVRALAREIDDAAKGAWADYHAGDAPYEVDVTGRIIGAIRERLHHSKFRGIEWRARTFRTARGRGAEEREYGADLLGVLDIELPKYACKKGFLAQAKRAEPETVFSQDAWNELVEQCRRMLRYTPDAYVIVYSKELGIRIFPANAVIGLTSRDIFDLYDRGVGAFFESYLECFIGDSRLDSPNIEALPALADFRAEHALLLTGRPAHDRRP